MAVSQSLRELFKGQLLHRSKELFVRPVAIIEQPFQILDGHVNLAFRVLLWSILAFSAGVNSVSLEHRKPRNIADRDPSVSNAAALADHGSPNVRQNRS
jgi:hypothetical protein